jgi:hypothetical protein
VRVQLPRRASGAAALMESTGLGGGGLGGAAGGKAAAGGPVKAKRLYKVSLGKLSVGLGRECAVATRTERTHGLFSKGDGDGDGAGAGARGGGEGGDARAAGGAGGGGEQEEDAFEDSGEEEDDRHESTIEVSVEAVPGGGDGGGGDGDGDGGGGDGDKTGAFASGRKRSVQIGLSTAEELGSALAGDESLEWHEHDGAAARSAASAFPATGKRRGIRTRPL